VLKFERQVVVGLLADAGTPTAPGVERFVDGSLRAMPQHLRLGVFGESLLLATWVRVRHLGRSDGPAVARLCESLGRSPIGLLRQYPRLFHSLVLFAENELAA
jgi:hypothetical protein